MKKGVLPPGTTLLSVNDKGDPRCQWIRRTFDDEGKENQYGMQCKKNAVNGRPFCGRHGGNNSGHVITGKYSKYHPLPKNLRDRFERAQHDPDLLNLTKAIALIDSQIWDICDGAKEQDSFTPKQTKQLVYLIRVQRDLVAQETTRRIAVGSMMEVGEVIQLINFVYNSIIKNVRDSKARAALGADLRLLIAERIPQVNQATASHVELTNLPDPSEASNAQEV